MTYKFLLERRKLSALQLKLTPVKNHSEGEFSSLVIIYIYV